MIVYNIVLLSTSCAFDKLNAVGMGKSRSMFDKIKQEDRVRNGCALNECGLQFVTENEWESNCKTNIQRKSECVKR